MPAIPDFSIEDLYVHPFIFGVDEVGRGPLAGPVVSAAVYIPRENRRHPVWREVRDSKQLSATKREILFSAIQTQCLFGIGQASPAEIDEINILQATFLAMRRAIESCPADPDMVLVDGNRSPKDWPWATRTIIKGDSQSVSIAAASILAKVTRDRIMVELDRDFPHYGWAHNSGYGTAEHLAGLSSHGITPHHRKTFAPIKHMDLERAA